MKSIKTNPNSAKGPDKRKIVNKLYCILLTTLELYWLYFFLEKKQLIKNYDAILLSKYDSAEKRY